MAKEDEGLQFANQLVWRDIDLRRDHRPLHRFPDGRIGVSCRSRPMQQWPGEAPEVDLCNVHLGGVGVDIVGMVFGVAVVGDVTRFQGLGDRVIFVCSPSLPAKSRVARIIVKLRGYSHVPWQPAGIWHYGLSTSGAFAMLFFSSPFHPGSSAPRNTLLIRDCHPGPPVRK